MSGTRKRHQPKFLDNDSYLADLAGAGIPVRNDPLGDTNPHTDEAFDPVAALLEETPIQGVIIPTERTDQFRVNLEHIRNYDNNPRLAVHNDEAIKALAWSIFRTGLINTITITKRPHEAHFIVAKGGNGRLKALSYIVSHYDELVAQLQPEESARPLVEFSRPTTRFEPYTSELAIFEAHLDENLEREETIWADTAHGLTQLKSLEEQQQGAPLSNREFAKSLEVSNRFRKIRSIETISRALFTTTQLASVLRWNPSAIANSQNSVTLLRQTYRDCQFLYCTFHDTPDTNAFNALSQAWTNAFCEKNPNPDPAIFGAELSAQWIIQTQQELNLDDETARTVWTNLRNNRPGGSAYKLANWNILLTPIADTTEATHPAPDTESESAGPIGTPQAPVEPTDPGATRPSLRQRVTRVERLSQLRTAVNQWRETHADLELPQPVIALVEHIATDSEDPFVQFLADAHKTPATQTLAKGIITYLRVVVAHNSERAAPESEHPAPTSSGDSP